MQFSTLRMRLWGVEFWLFLLPISERCFSPAGMISFLQTSVSENLPQKDLVGTLECKKFAVKGVVGILPTGVKGEGMEIERR